MPLIGFSTGSLALGDFHEGLAAVRRAGLRAIEFSALRECELEPLVEFLRDAELADFEYVSLHAPSRLDRLLERDVVDMLGTLGPRGFPIVLHPDVVQDPQVWRRLGDKICIENMDQRKASGRLASEMESVFRLLPDARLCLDLAHALQVDPTMSEARRLLEQFGDRVRQVHISSLDSNSFHRPLTQTSIWAFQSLIHLLPPTVPWILEGSMDESGVQPEVTFVASLVG